MAWPTALTTDADVLKFAFSQGVSRALETGNDYSDLHEGVSTVVRNWIEANRWSDADEVTNSDAFKPAAVNYFLYLLFREKNPELANDYKTEFYARMNQTNVRLPPEERSGATFAVPRLRKVSRRRLYTSRRGDAIYKNNRDH